MVLSHAAPLKGGLLLLALSIACGDSTGAGAGGSGGSPNQYAGTPCDTCDKTVCASEHAACAAEADCAAYLTCLGSCDLDAAGDAEASCEATCAETHAASQAVLDEFRSCRSNAVCPTTDALPMPA